MAHAVCSRHISENWDVKIYHLAKPEKKSEALLQIELPGSYISMTMNCE
jgi:hypothetical protein